MEPVCEVHPMEVGGEGSNEDGSCSREVPASEDPADFEDSAQEIIDYATEGSYK